MFLAVKTIADAKTNTATLAGTGPDSSSVVFLRILNELFGMKFRIVTGYEGVNNASLAMERGEVDGIVRPWAVIKTSRPDWLADKKINLIVQYTVDRHPELKNVPAVVELAENETQRQILSLYASGADIGRAIVAPRLQTAEVAKAAQTREEKENETRARLKVGELGLDIYKMRDKLVKAGLVYIDEAD